MSVIVFFVLFLSAACHIISARDIPTIFVVFGRPGSGKSTLVGLTQQKLEGYCKSVDLDVCVTEEMKTNFQNGIYPNHDERGTFFAV